MSKIILKKNEDRRIKEGHLWIFSNEIQEMQGDAENGDVAEVFERNNSFLGEGFYNKNSLIAVRLFSNSKIDSLKNAFERKLDAAFRLRRELYPRRNAYRLAFSESDYLPGLIIDKYNDTYVLQVYSAGIERNIGIVADILSDKYGAKNIFTKNEEHFRKLEGLPVEDRVYHGAEEAETISDGYIRYNIDFGKGQKTGFYFDQADNRRFAGKLCKDKDVLDAFCNSGGFGLHAALNGAAKVTFIDASKTEVSKAEENFRLNALKSETEFVDDDVFAYFEKASRENRKFDVVMIDPPAFAKNKKSLPAARKGYEKLNRMAMNAVKEEGYLVTSSCSYHLHKEEFLSIINAAAVKSKKQIQLIHYNGASLDHPVIPAMEETEYLKFAIYRICEKI